MVRNSLCGSAQGTDTQLVDCDITSASGSGVGVEGGAPTLLRCRVHGCERHGLALFGDVLGGSDSGACPTPDANCQPAHLMSEALTTCLG